MATIKSYTDLEQSKKLAEILPLESADMHYGNFSPKGLGYENKFSAGLTPYIKEIKVYEELKESYKIKDYNGIVTWQVIPCWSLAALLDILKDKIIFGGNSPEGWFCCYTIKNPTKTLTIDGDSLVDACYEMIIKLNEQKLL